MRQALSGIKIIEIGTFIAGPYCAMILGDHGADVIKVERPGGGDENRAEPPFVNGESAPFMLWNRNKRSVVLDLKLAEDRDIMLSLAAEADVLIENMRPGALDRLGLGWSVLPHTMVDKELKILDFEDANMERTLGVVCHTARTLSNAAQALVQMLEQRKSLA